LSSKKIKADFRRARRASCGLRLVSQWYCAAASGERQHPLWLLNTEVARAEQLGHVVRMTAHTEMRADDSRHTLCVPQVIWESGSQRAGINQIVQQQQLFFGQFRRATRAGLCQHAFIAFLLGRGSQMMMLL
jgi:hypothetical protein